MNGAGQRQGHALLLMPGSKNVLDPTNLEHPLLAAMTLQHKQG